MKILNKEEYYETIRRSREKALSSMPTIIRALASSLHNTKDIIGVDVLNYYTEKRAEMIQILTKGYRFPRRRGYRIH